MACKGIDTSKQQPTPVTVKEDSVKHKEPIPHWDSLLSVAYNFYADSIIKSHNALIQQLFSKYVYDTCAPVIYQKLEYRPGEFEGIKSVGDINNNGLPDSVFAMSPLSWCDYNDEDGICEVGFFYSACSSRYKSLRFYRLKDKKWEKIGASEFDILTQEPTEVKFSNLVRKISRNRFIAKNFYDGRKYWDTIIIK